MNVQFLAHCIYSGKSRNKTVAQAQRLNNIGRKLHASFPKYSVVVPDNKRFDACIKAHHTYEITFCDNLGGLEILIISAICFEILKLNMLRLAECARICTWSIMRSRYGIKLHQFFGSDYVWHTRAGNVIPVDPMYRLCSWTYIRRLLSDIPTSKPILIANYTNKTIKGFETQTLTIEADSADKLEIT